MEPQRDELIAAAMKALPYRRPSAGFKTRVMAAVAEAPAAEPWLERAEKAAGLLLAGWAAVLGLLAGRYAADAAALVLEPGGLERAAGSLAVQAVLFLAKAKSLLLFAVGLASAALPPWYETAAALLLFTGALAALSGRAALNNVGARG